MYDGYFPPGPPRRGYRPPAPYPEVYLPHMAPYFYHPFMPYYVAPNTLPPYIRPKDLRALSGMGSRAVLPMASSSAPIHPQVPSDLAQHLDPHHYLYMSESPGGWDLDDDIFDFDDDDLLGDDDDLLGDLYGAGGKAPFKAVSELFKKDGKVREKIQQIAEVVRPQRNGKSKVEEVMEAAQQLTAPQQPPMLPAHPFRKPPEPGMSTGAKVAVGVGAGLGLLGIGILVGRAVAGR